MIQNRKIARAFQRNAEAYEPFWQETPVDMTELFDKVCKAASGCKDLGKQEEAPKELYEDAKDELNRMIKHLEHEQHEQRDVAEALTEQLEVLEQMPAEFNVQNVFSELKHSWDNIKDLRSTSLLIEAMLRLDSSMPSIDETELNEILARTFGEENK